MMAKYIDKADIVKLISECMFDLSDSDDLTKMFAEVDELPSVEIIHCKECEHYFDTRNIVGCSVGKCEELGLLYTNGEWYCGNAKRRKDS